MKGIVLAGGSGTGSCMYMVSVQVFLWDVLQWHWQKS